MNKKMRLLAVPVLALGTVAMAGAPAMADHATGSYSSNLGQLNGTTGTGTVTVDVEGTTATVNLEVSGLAETFMDGPYPHVQHIHGLAMGTCPTGADDANADGIVSVTEGAAKYGGIQTTLTTSGATGPEEGLNLALAGQGGSYTIQRSFEINQGTQDALDAGTAVVVVHGLDPATAGVSEEVFNSPSDLDPALPLGATSPALCGNLAASQMGAMPEGGADTGVAQESGSNLTMIALGGGLVLAAAAGGTFMVRRSNAKA
ncbi:CHRD domain-containing protein [Arthrobacter sp. 260]|uniref:CHRD domain-containing protein n=1 Tax=Arthrobacter sp. 260 TaxID=2735314 RepID=UPI0014912ACF|nr:CHRD domain-containing protein [Arthrobacter sp. 260]NOJ61623.1 CHRD domain-containing protein [Arthrobacter sp. 260]